MEGPGSIPGRGECFLPFLLKFYFISGNLLIKWEKSMEDLSAMVVSQNCDRAGELYTRLGRKNIGH